MVRTIGAVRVLHSDEDKKIYLPETGIRKFLIGHECPDETAHHDFEAGKVGAQCSSRWFLNLNFRVS